MKSPTVGIWKFSQAPKGLQSLHHDAGVQAWLARVPRELRGKDLDVLIAGNPKSSVSRHTLPNGDLVYIGAPLTEVSPVLAQSGRPKSARISSR